MADVRQHLQAIMDAVYGEEVRGSIHDSIEAINAECEGGVAATSANAQAAAASEAAAKASERAAAASEAAAKASEAASSASMTEAKSWAVGGTGTREGEDRDNAKYWSDIASQAVTSGGVASFNGRAGVVFPQQGDYSDADISPSPKATTFGADGSITEAYNDRRNKVTTFNPDGSITEKMTGKGGEALWTKTTRFNPDGSITEEAA